MSIKLNYEYLRDKISNVIKNISIDRLKLKHGAGFILQ